MDGHRIPPFGLRLPEDLKEVIRLAAFRNRRSMNAEIVFHLEAIFCPAEKEHA